MEHETGAGGVPVYMLTHARGDRESLSWAKKAQAAAA